MVEKPSWMCMVISPNDMKQISKTIQCILYNLILNAIPHLSPHKIMIDGFNFVLINPRNRTWFNFRT